jgi:glycine/D-amino acid oxidase-like deaminating enzyme
MRTVHRIQAMLAGTTSLPSFFLPNGVYALPESAGSFLVGWSREEDPVGFDFRYSRATFEPLIWPELVTALPAFDRLRVAGGWAGLYAVNTLDGNAILGEWPELAGLYLANGFSGHGFQQCAAVGRYLAELITDRKPTLDLARLGPRRIVERQPLPDAPDRII